MDVAGGKELDRFVEDLRSTDLAIRVVLGLLEEVELLDKTAPVFFVRVFEALDVTILMGLSRITDPQKQSGLENFTLASAHRALGIPAFTRDARRWEAATRVLEGVLPAVRKVRNKQIAHLDRKTLSGDRRGPSNLSADLLRKVHKALAAIIVIIDRRGSNAAVSDNNLLGTDDLFLWLERGLDLLDQQKHEHEHRIQEAPSD